jgi:hypothetical protein
VKGLHYILRVEHLDVIKILAQIMNNFAKVRQNEKYFNLCQNGKGTTIYWWERFLLCFVMQAKAHYTCQRKVDEV